MYFMGVDMGTSGCKAVVFDEKWNIVCRAYREYPTKLVGVGGLELDPEQVIDGIFAVIREANAASQGRTEALAVSAIGDVIIPLKKDGSCVRDSIIDFDPRGGAEIASFTEAFGVRSFFDITGMPPLYIGSLAKILYLRDQEPEHFAQIGRYATYEDFVVERLGLPATVSYSEAARTMLFDIRKKEWAEEILSLVPVKKEQLPKAVPSGAKIGEIPAERAAELGFSGTCAVYAGGHDMVCAAVGAGLNEDEPETAVDIAGTIEGLVASMREANTRPELLQNNLPCYPGCSAYVTFSVNLTAGAVVRWYRDKLAEEDYRSCRADGKNFYEDMLEKLDPANPGTVLVLPHFSGSGNPFFNAEGLGSIYGMNLDTDRKDIARGIAEGLAYELRMHLAAYESAGIRLKTLRAVGGGSAIDTQLQMKANVTGCTVIKGAVTESSALGAAAYAAYGAGVVENPADVYASVRGNEKRFDPDPAAHERFSRKFEQYRELAYGTQELDLKNRS